MSRIKIKLETITPVHVGTGNLLYPREDYLYDEAKKIIKILQPATSNVIREMNLYPNNINIQARGKEVRELMRNGMGLPYIPGSSIKGAIRTAILAELVYNTTDNEYDALQGIIKKGRNSVDQVAKEIEGYFFGSDPKNDILRFLIISDAMFPKGSECIQCTYAPIKFDYEGNLAMINPGYEMYVEALSVGQMADSFSITFREMSHRLTYSNKECSELPFGLNSIDELFKVINDHTFDLIEKEMGALEDNLSDPDVEAYCKQLSYVKQQIPGDNHSCILRVGFGSGWKGITGDWVSDFEGWEHLVPYNVDKVRIFPRTRRTAYNSYLLGFLKMSK